MNHFPSLNSSEFTRRREVRNYSWPQSTSSDTELSSFSLLTNSRRWKRTKKLSALYSGQQIQTIPEAFDPSEECETLNSFILSSGLCLPSYDKRIKSRRLSRTLNRGHILRSGLNTSERKYSSKLIFHNYLATIPEEELDIEIEEISLQPPRILPSTFDFVKPLSTLSSVLASTLTPPTESILSDSVRSAKTADGHALSSRNSLLNCRSRAYRSGSRFRFHRWKRNRWRNSAINTPPVNGAISDQRKFLTNVTSNSVTSNETWPPARKVTNISLAHPIVGNLRWQISSCGNAVTERGLAAGRRLSAAGIHVWENAKEACGNLSEMADNKFQVLKKSISSWSLSTIKKPTISAPKFRKPKIKLFSRKKVKPEEEKKTISTKDTGENDSFVSDESTSGTVIHEPRDKEKCNNQPYIILTDHDAEPSQDVDRGSDIQTESEEDIRDYTDGPLEKLDKDFTDTSDADRCSVVLTNNNNVESKFIGNAIKFIDDDDDNDKSGNHKDQTLKSCLGISIDEYYSWFDAEGPSLRSLEKENQDTNNEEYANYIASEYYDASESRTITPSGRSYEDIEILDSNEPKLPGSSKAREWVKSFDEKNINDEINKNNPFDEEVVLPRSRSEVHLNNLDGKRIKNEIVLNTNEKSSISSMKNLFSKFVPKINKTQNISITRESPSTKECEEIERRESIKKIFGVRGKVSHKTTVIDSNFFKDSDIHLASTPFVLTNSVKSYNNDHKESKDSLDTFEDNLKESSEQNISDSSSAREQIVDETEELMREIEKYLSDTDYIGQPKPKTNNMEHNSNSQANIVSKDDENIHKHTIEEKEKCLPIESSDKNILDDGDKENIKFDNKNILQHNNTKVDVCEVSSIHNIVNDNTKTNEDIKNGAFKENQLENESNENVSETIEYDQITNQMQQNKDITAEIHDGRKTINEDKIKKVGINFPNSLKTFKENIFFSENKDLSKLKEEWKKKKSKLNPFRQKLKNKNSDNITQTDRENLEVKCTDCNIDESSINTYIPDQYCSFTATANKEMENDEHQNEDLGTSVPDADNYNKSEAEVHKVQIHSDIKEEDDKHLAEIKDDRKELEEPSTNNLDAKMEISVDDKTQKDKPLSSPSNNIEITAKNHLENQEIQKSEQMKDYNYANFIANPITEKTKSIKENTVICDTKLNTDYDKQVKNSTAKESKDIEEICIVYENSVVEEDESLKYQENPKVYPRSEITQPNIEITDTPSIVKPKPNPRTKKGKYGYSKQVKSNSQLDQIVSVNEEQNTLNKVKKIPDIVIERERNSILLENGILNDLKEHKIDFHNNKNEVRIRNSYPDENNLLSEPIYWEIGDSPTAPVANPRKRKERTQNRSPYSSTNDIKGSSELPEWIQQRPPIPSPRSKKPKSTQSLVQELESESQDDIQTVKNINVFGSSFTNLKFDDPKQRNETKWSGEDFYSGKAASISYGITFRDSPPVLPQRSKKSSLTSLPAAISNEEPSPFVRYIKAPSELHKKRTRRKTSPAIPPRGTSKHQSMANLNPLQVLEENLHYFMQIITSISEPKPNQTKSEELLSDVLYSVLSIMGRDVANTWAVISPGVNSQNNKGINVTLGRVRSHLQEAFQMSSEQFNEILQDVLKREAANVTLTLKILEASELRVKTVKGGSNPFVTVTVPGSNQSHRTRTEHETLNPKWHQEFRMKVKNLNKDVLKLEVWHDLDPNVVTQVSAVKDLKSLQRLVKGTTALAQKQETHLLGSVQVPIKEIRENGIKNWFSLYKENVKDEAKERGQIHIEAFVTAAKQGIPLSEARRSHDALLAKLIYHHIKTVSNNNAEELSFQLPWHGQLSPEANAAIAQHAIILGLPPAHQNLSWWIVGSRIPSSDAGWQLKYLKIVQSDMSTGAFDTKDLECLADSFADWIEYSLLKLRNLKKSFPTTSGIIAKHQLSSLLLIFIALESHKETSSLLEIRQIKDLRNQVREAVTDYMKVWWTRLIEEHLKGETIPEHQVQKIVIITAEAYNFLTEIATFYSPSLLKEMNIPYFREMFLMITKKLNPCVRPPLINVYNHLENVSELTFPDEDEKKISTLTLEDGTNLWQLYMNTGRLYKLGLDLPLDIRQESGIYDYHKWFNKAVKRWVELAKTKAELMIEKAVKLDDFEPIDEYNNFSSSATDVSGIFTDVQIWWQKLEWPDPENSMILLARILEDICSYGMKYADLLKQKVEVMFSVQSNSDQLVISKQICTGLNNIERIRDELTRLPEKFGVRSLIASVKSSQTGGEEASERFRTNINMLIEISSENMETKVTEFIEAVMDKMSGTLHHAVIQACEASSEKSLFTEVLDPALQLMHKNMSDNNFRRFLQRLWEVLIELFHVNVTRNTDKRKASYFNGVYNILNSSVKFFSPCEGVGLTEEGIHTQDFTHLIELLECLRLSSENLISRYYNERCEEQKLLNAQSKGELIVRAFFTRAGKLVIEVIMAKDMQLSNEVSSLTSKTSQFGSQNQQIDSYVKVQIMPLEWFPTIHEMKTKTMRNSDPAVFEETFEFEMKIDDNGASNGFILFTIKDYHLGRSNKFIGECVIPLQDLQCIDSSDVHTIPNIYIKITQPGMECGYPSLRALRLRTGDKVASGFLKKIQPRLSDARQKIGCSAISSDEEKPRSRSPRLLQKFGLS